MVMKKLFVPFFASLLFIGTSCQGNNPASSSTVPTSSTENTSSQEQETTYYALTMACIEVKYDKVGGEATFVKDLPEYNYQVFLRPGESFTVDTEPSLIATHGTGQTGFFDDGTVHFAGSSRKGNINWLEEIGPLQEDTTYYYFQYATKPVFHNSEEDEEEEEEEPISITEEPNAIHNVVFCFFDPSVTYTEEMTRSIVIPKPVRFFVLRMRKGEKYNINSYPTYATYFGTETAKARKIDASHPCFAGSEEIGKHQGADTFVLDGSYDPISYIYYLGA